MSSNPWIEHVRKYAKDNNVSYREAMKMAKASYKGKHMEGGKRMVRKTHKVKKFVSACGCGDCGKCNGEY